MYIYIRNSPSVRKKNPTTYFYGLFEICSVVWPSKMSAKRTHNPNKSVSLLAVAVREGFTKKKYEGEYHHSYGIF